MLLQNLSGGSLFFWTQCRYGTLLEHGCSVAALPAATSDLYVGIPAGVEQGCMARGNSVVLNH